MICLLVSLLVVKPPQWNCLCALSVCLGYSVSTMCIPTTWKRFCCIYIATWCTAGEAGPPAAGGGLAGRVPAPWNAPATPAELAMDRLDFVNLLVFNNRSFRMCQREVISALLRVSPLSSIPGLKANRVAPCRILHMSAVRFVYNVHNRLSSTLFCMMRYSLTTLIKCKANQGSANMVTRYAIRRCSSGAPRVAKNDFVSSQGVVTVLAQVWLF